MISNLPIKRKAPNIASKSQECRGESDQDRSGQSEHFSDSKNSNPMLLHYLFREALKTIVTLWAASKHGEVRDWRRNPRQLIMVRIRIEDVEAVVSPVNVLPSAGLPSALQWLLRIN